MTYREKLSESEHKAHYQNIATKILREMTALRASVDTSPNTPRRWVWELLQNAKDVNGGAGVNVKISKAEKSKKKYLLFEHDGLPFTADNIRFLIEQISSKDRTKDSEGKREQSGKFGTGFLTTHLLSEIVYVKGVAKEDGLDYRKFSFKLDRSGFEIKEIIKAVEASKKQVLNIDSLEPYLDYKDSDFNTAFIYSLEDDLSLKVTEDGINDLNVNLPYTLCFVNQINTVTVNPEAKVFEVVNEEYLDQTQKLKVITIKISAQERDPEYLTFASLNKGLTTIIIPVETSADGIAILPIGSHVPKIFCDFPLLGTESFPFPAIINNPGFNPTDPRDGIFLTDSPRANPPIEENKQILIDAVDLYFDLLDFATGSNWANLHLLAKTGSLREPIKSNTSVTWFEDYVQNPIRGELNLSNIVKTSVDTLKSILDAEGKAYMQFPSGASKEIMQKIWNLAEMWFPYAIPTKEHVEFWHSNSWADCEKLTLSRLASYVESTDELFILDSKLQIVDGITWLNSFYEVLALDKGEYLKIIDSQRIFPDQNGLFVKKSLLKRQDGKIDSVFKDILQLFGKDIRSELVDESIIIDFEDNDQYTQADAVRAINAEVEDKTRDRESAQEYRPALNMILKYFNEHPSTAKSLFPSIYSKKYILYDDEEIMDNINKAEELKDLLEIFNVASSDELRRKFENLAESGKSLLPVTEEIITSMGITNLQEWEEAMLDVDLSALFDHQSVPTTEMFVLSQAHISRARDRVIAHLETLDDYDLGELDPNTAPTILAGVYKNDAPVKIVFRPAYSQEVIVYYGAEKDALDYADAELWVDDGKIVRQISLGHILKINNIKKFPI